MPIYHSTTSHVRIKEWGSRKLECDLTNRPAGPTMSLIKLGAPGSCPTETATLVAAGPRERDDAGGSENVRAAQPSTTTPH